MSRTEIRELAFKLIYSLEIQSQDEISEQIEIYLEDNNIESENAQKYIKDIILGINKNEQEIINIIKSVLTERWTIERISKINLSILKLAIFEIKYKDIPFKVEINETVELAKKYGDENSARFINGALAKVIKELNIT